MNRKFLNMMLCSLLAGSMATGFVSCKDYDDDISNLQSQIDENKDAIATINSQIASGAILTSVAKTPDGKGLVVTVTKNGASETYTITNGQNGKDGKDGKDGLNGQNGKDGKDGLNGQDGKDGLDAVIWSIGDDGYWYKDGVKTEYKAVGQDGKDGLNGKDGKDGVDGKDGLNGADGKDGNDGKDGLNGADGKDGKDGKDGLNGADGKDGKDGKDGLNGADGKDGKDGLNGADGKDGLNGDYYVPNPETGYFVHYVWDAAQGKYVVDENGAIKYAEPADKISNITAVDDGVNLTICGMVGADGKPLGAIVIAKSGALRSMVFQPDLYLNGVEATRYAYAPNVPILEVNANATKKFKAGGHDYNITGTAGFKVSDNDADKNVNIPSLSFVEYALNPSTADVSDFTFTMTGTQKETVSRAADAPIFKIEGEPVNEAGVLKLAYKVTNPDVIKAPEKGKDKGLLTIFNAKAEDKAKEKKETIVSDFGAILPEKVVFSSLAFTKDSKEVVEKVVEGEGMKDNQDLYTTAKSALSYETTPVKVKWDQTYTLKNIICVHYLAADFDLPTSGDHKVMTLAEAEKYYGLKASFENVPYLIGGNETGEDMYAIVEDGVFYPAHVVEDGDNYKSEKNTTENGKSSVGRKPLVLVTLANAQGQIVLNGYVVFEITLEEPTPQGDIIEPAILTSGTFGYLCDFELKSSWEQWSNKVLENDKIKLSNEKFHEKYYLTTTTIDNKTYAKTFIKGTDGKFKPESKFGTIEVLSDAGEGQVNSVLKWTGELAEVEAIFGDKESDHSETLYVEYKTTSEPATYVYVGMTVTISDAGRVANWSDTEGKNRITNEWDGDMLKLHVAAPANSEDVKTFEYDLTNAWLNGKLGVKCDAKNYNTNINYTFKWSNEQESGYKVVDDQLKYNDEVIATLTTAGVVTYNNNSAVAKKLLNDGVMKPTGHVEIVATYGSCNIEFPNTSKFVVKFLRPLSMENGENPTFIPAAAGGSTAKLASLFKLKDWRGKAVTELDKNGMMQSVEENGVDLYKFYGVESIIIDKNAIKFENGKDADGNIIWKPITENLNANLNITGGETKDNVVTIDAKDPSGVNAAEFIYTSKSQGVTTEHKLQIPVTIVYAWGELNGDMTATVKVTLGQE